jgi:hypothetical protein
MKSNSLVLSPSRRSFRYLMVALVLSGAAVVSVPAIAEQATDAQTSAQLRYRQAVDAFKEKKWDTARRLLLELWQQSHTYDVAYTLGQTEYQLGHYAAAANYLQFVIANIPPTEKLGAAEQHKKNLASLQARTARVSIVTDQPSAEIAIDGELVGTSPLDSVVYVEAGPHKIEARLGERNAAQTIDAALGSLTPVDLKLGTIPESPLPLTPDPSVGSGLDAKPPNSQPRKHQTAKLVVVGAGATLTVAAAVVGTIYAVRASSSQSDIDRLKSQVIADLGGNCASSSSGSVCAELDRAIQDRNSANQVARAAFITSGVLAVGTVATFFLWPAEKASSATRITPSFDRYGGAITVQGAF